MSFFPYPSIINHGAISYRTILRLGEIECVGLEKIHGSNVSVVIESDESNTTTITWCRRNDVMRNTEGLYNIDGCFDAIEPKLHILYDLIKENYDHNHNNIIVRVYGELCGGEYNDMPKIEGTQRIQKDMNGYSPHNVWIPFDIMIEITPNFEETETETIWLSYNQFKEYCDHVDLVTTPVVVEDCFGNLINNFTVDNVPSLVHNIYDLPEVPDFNMEGIIIRGKDRDIMLNRTHRLIVKKKAAAFSERTVKSITMPNVEMSDYQKLIFDILSDYINDNRCASVISKLPSEDNQNIDKITGLMIRDAFKDMMDEDHSIVLNKNDKKKIILAIGTQATQIVISHVML